ncbi:hypothetical protein Bbelb_385720 [Branchiostoma belcheri]|nr:hypothetical protein Bbelb_385720 [Branchiostoma belcheri]
MPHYANQVGEDDYKEFGVELGGPDLHLRWGDGNFHAPAYLCDGAGPRGRGSHLHKIFQLSVYTLEVRATQHGAANLPVAGEASRMVSDGAGANHISPLKGRQDNGCQKTERDEEESSAKEAVSGRTFQMLFAAPMGWF